MRCYKSRLSRTERAELLAFLATCQKKQVIERRGVSAQLPPLLPLTVSTGMGLLNVILVALSALNLFLASGHGSDLCAP